MIRSNKRVWCASCMLFIIIVRKGCWLINFYIEKEKEKIEQWRKENQLSLKGDDVPRETRSDAKNSVPP